MTIELTILAMALGIALGVVLAVMRLTGNPVLSSVAWTYLWIFRGTPIYVQLVFWGLFTALYPHLQLGIPWGPTFATFDIQTVDAAFFFAVLGLGLNEAAYMAEIVRAGITSVSEGQNEAATALGMSCGLTMLSPPSVERPSDVNCRLQQAFAKMGKGFAGPQSGQEPSSRQEVAAL